MRSMSDARHRGFTLIELLVAMALLVILTTILASFVANAQKIYDSSVQQAEVMANARAAVGIIQRDLNGIMPTTTTSALPIPAGDNVPRGLLMRSPGMVDPDDWTEDDLSTEAGWPGYAQMPPEAPPQANESEVKNSAFLQFFSTVRYYDPNVLNPNTGEFGMFQQRPVLVQYYLRRRPQFDDGSITTNMPGAFLMRRIQPYETSLDSTGTLSFDNWGQPVEDDICSFVRGVRVYYYDRDREINAAQDSRFIEATDNPNPDWADQTLLPENAPTPQPPEVDPANMAGLEPLWRSSFNAVIFELPEAWQGWVTAQSPEFTKEMFLPPSIMIELLVTNSDGYVFREVRDIFSLPGAPKTVPRNPKRQ